MVAEFRTRSQLLAKVAEIYDWLDSQISESADWAGQCHSCGSCCDFDVFGHHLFVTTPELMFLAANLGDENIKGSHFAIHRKMGSKPMRTSRCPYNIDGKCSVYEYRFAGCRIFCCKANQDFQSTLSESTLKKLRSLCIELNIPYWYNDLATALNGFTIS